MTSDFNMSIGFDLKLISWTENQRIWKHRSASRFYKI